MRNGIKNQHIKVKSRSKIIEDLVKKSVRPPDPMSIFDFVEDAEEKKALQYENSVNEKLNKIEAKIAKDALHKSNDIISLLKLLETYDDKKIGGPFSI